MLFLAFLSWCAKKVEGCFVSNNYIVYCLYTKVGGVFYVGCGRGESRLRNTVRECEQPYLSNSLKCRYIHACQARGIQVHAWVVCQCSKKQRAEEIEYALIQMYPSALTNALLNWHPMRQLPDFLQGLSGQPEAVEAVREQPLRDSERGPFNEEINSFQAQVKQKRLKQVVDSLLASNDTVSLPGLRWYISVPVVCDLLGGSPSNEKKYLVKKYLASRQDELEAHHCKHGLTENDNRKLIPITKRVKVEPEVAYEPYQERFQRAVDALLAYNDAVSLPELRWYIDEEVVHDLLGGQSSGMKTYSLVAQYLAERRHELEAHHRKYGLTPEHNRKRTTNGKHIRVRECVKVNPPVSGEPYRERFQRATNAILAYNDAISLPELQWYISATVVYDLLGGRSSGVLRYLVELYLAERRHELEAHHYKHGLIP
jgi:hypothetical protein